MIDDYDDFCYSGGYCHYPFTISGEYRPTESELSDLKNVLKEATIPYKENEVEMPVIFDDNYIKPDSFRIKTIKTLNTITRTMKTIWSN